MNLIVEDNFFAEKRNNIDKGAGLEAMRKLTLFVNVVTFFGAPKRNFFVIKHFLQFGDLQHRTKNNCIKHSSICFIRSPGEQNKAKKTSSAFICAKKSNR